MVLEVSSYSTNTRDLINNRFSINAYVRDWNTNKTYKFGSLFIESIDSEVRQNKRFSFAVPQTLKGSNVIVGIEAIGLKPNLSNVKYGFAHIYTDDSMLPEKVFAKKESQKSENLLHNYPNPFNPTTKIKYAVGSMENVVLIVFDLLGREVATIVNEPRSAGEYEIEFNASKYGLTSGVYFYQLRAGKFISTKKFILAK